MSHADEQIRIDISASRRRELVARLCLALNEELTAADDWASGCEIRHWQVAVADFLDLPAGIIEAVLEEWSESGDRLDEIEFSGYLDTGDGHRAWGFLAVRGGEAHAREYPRLERATTEETEDGLALTVTIIRRALPDDRATAHD
ncbi:hypothetical protein BH23CHL3_BH23CHL3_02650 [soil metagenome]|jgi:hypothetical protein